MVYRRVREELFPRSEKIDTETGASQTGAVSYRVYERGDCAAECSYRVELVCTSQERRFVIDGIRLCESYATASVMEAVLQFLQYKAQTAGCRDMIVTLDRKNLFYLEQYQRFGFYLIDQSERKTGYGQVRCDCVLKYPLPTNREELYRGYILRSARGNGKTNN